MKNVYKIIGIFIVLVATGTTAQADAKYAAKAFVDVCLSAAPTFKSVPAKAAKYGGRDFMSIGDLNIASVSAKDISIQYEVGKEGTVTTSKDAAASDVLLKAVRSKFKVNSIPAHVEINQGTFLIAHSRKGGEAFVIIKK